MNEIACANCGESVMVGCLCHHCGYRDETDWPSYTIGDDDAESSETDGAEGEWDSILRDEGGGEGG